MHTCQLSVLKICKISKNERLHRPKNKKCTRGCGKLDFENRESHAGSVRPVNYECGYSIHIS